MTLNYTPVGVCSRNIEIVINDDTQVIEKVKFTGGCMGNTQGVASLVEGMKAEDVIQKLKGIDCKGRGTSCPDQLAAAVSEALEKM